MSLCTIADVKENLSIGNNASDARLTKLVTRASAFFLSKTNRPAIAPVTVAERRDGNGANRITPYFWPIISVASVTIDGVAIQASPDGVAPGWINDLYLVMLVNGAGGRSFSSPGVFRPGFQNVVITYTYGWAVQPEDITQAVVELVSQKFRRSQHIDQTSQKSADGQMLGFSTKSIPEEVQDVIEQYRIKAIIE